MKTEQLKELAKKFLDCILYDCGFIDRMHPFNESIHYGDWVKKLETELEKIVPELGEDYFTTEFIEEFADGDYEDMMKNCEKYSCLKPLNQMLNDYYDWLCENINY